MVWVKIIDFNFLWVRHQVLIALGIKMAVRELLNIYILNLHKQNAISQPSEDKVTVETNTENFAN